MPIARLSIGKISDTVRYAALAPAEAKKNVIDQQMVIVVADSMSCWNIQPVISRPTADAMYVEKIIGRRPIESKKWPSTIGPSTLPMANGKMKYATSLAAIPKNVVSTSA